MQKRNEGYNLFLTAYLDLVRNGSDYSYLYTGKSPTNEKLITSIEITVKPQNYRHYRMYYQLYYSETITIYSSSTDTYS